MYPKKLMADRAISAGAYALASPAMSDDDRFGRKDTADLADVRKSLKTQKEVMESAHEKFESWIKKADEQMKANGELSAEVKEALEGVTTSAKEALEKHGELEQELANIRESIDKKTRAAKSIGQQFSEGDAWKAMSAKERDKASMEFKAITEATTGTGDAGDLIEPTRVPGVIAQPDRPMFVRQLLSIMGTTSNSIEYVREQGFTNAAAAVAEGAQKPESDIKFELETAPVRTLAHWIMASEQVLADVPMLMGYIDQRLRYGLMLEEEDQILSGDGTGQNLLGLIPQATDYDTNRTQVGDTRIDIIRRALTQVRIAEYMADAIVMHPDDWESIELTKTTDGAYVWANPMQMAAGRLWGLPVVTSTALESGEFLVGNFRMSASIFDRMQARVDVSREDRDNFIKNMVTIRGEERLALAVFRPEAMIYGDFNDIVSGG
jgi:HK97 family phage major capsid protein|tara:strand:+ start:76 stop:1386 length:1311 start_codon:yes stop_codon:yes gene_type:complete